MAKRKSTRRRHRRRRRRRRRGGRTRRMRGGRRRRKGGRRRTRRGGDLFGRTNCYLLDGGKCPKGMTCRYGQGWGQMNLFGLKGTSGICVKKGKDQYGYKQLKLF